MRWNLKGRLAYVGGLVLLALGALSLIGAPPVGVVILLLGLYVFPPTRRRLRIDVSARRLVVWCVGVFLVLFGLVTAQKLPLPGALAVGAGLLALPPVREQLQRRGGVELRGPVVAVVVLVAAASSMWLVAIDVDTDAERGNVTHEMNESFVVNAHEDGKLRANVTGARALLGADPVGDSTPMTPTDEVFLLVSVTFENVGNDSVMVEGRSGGVVALVTADHDDVYSPSFRADVVGYDPGVDNDVFHIYENDIRLEPGEEVSGTLVYSVDADHQYHLRVSPDGPKIEGDNHYVPISVETLRGY
ncbi:protein of unknown function [Halorientalis persicus]|uniref:DUF4352 domain-containing protein n=1 Tax=Halorientalis persicus TaxID=1367881 RepID=A0A1H8EXL9_9EURY|nr:DUF4352 domain-containing protein [Halorientalis persicus]SEN24136.1 protein of unknown function [Halorientalis persicus]